MRDLWGSGGSSWGLGHWNGGAGALGTPLQPRRRRGAQRANDVDGLVAVGNRGWPEWKDLFAGVGELWGVVHGEWEGESD